MCFTVFHWPCWGSNQRPYACWAGVLPLSYAWPQGPILSPSVFVSVTPTARIFFPISSSLGWQLSFTVDRYRSLVLSKSLSTILRPAPYRPLDKLCCSIQSSYFLTLLCVAINTNELWLGEWLWRVPKQWFTSLNPTSHYVRKPPLLPPVTVRNLK